jgi:ATP-dependent DNA helicase PIF1
MNDEVADKIYNDLINRKNVFLSGPGGTGKSHLIKALHTRLNENRYLTYKTASTGVAAVSINGTTLHSWAGVQLGEKTAETYAITIKSRNKKAYIRWVSTDILIIDEISMIGHIFFQMLSDLGKILRKSAKPFGGITLLFVGDVCQLPPVRQEYFFNSLAYSETTPIFYNLSHPYRFLGDLRFFELLLRARVGQCNEEDIQMLAERKNAYMTDVLNKKFGALEIKPTRLFSRKLDVTTMNLNELALIKSQEFRYTCTDHLKKKHAGSTAKIENFQDLMDQLVPTEIAMKNTAQVMLTFNVDVENGLCNGSRGVIVECADEFVTVLFKNGLTVNIEPVTWSIENDDELFTRTQMPLILAYSITIHKSQSATLDSVIVDMGTSIFSDNMGYVALSRCRSIDSLYITDLMPSKIQCDKEALNFELNVINAPK